MMKKSTFAFVIAAGLLAVGCGATPIKGKPLGAGSIYSEVQFNEGANEAGIGTKRGEACATNILGILSTGDASASSAARKAGITKIGAVDGMHSNILGIYSKYCTVVSGD
jgi:hypothetical protein